mmetsp:Transcript_10826/g.29681  ORF Transcript_10826/g.29681 Transcript_10826/m.29681 type:complete len:290 (+) Transcript_10826:164-1033(+)
MMPRGCSGEGEPRTAAVTFAGGCAARTNCTLGCTCGCGNQVHEPPLPPMGAPTSTLRWLIMGLATGLLTSTPAAGCDAAKSSARTGCCCCCCDTACCCGCCGCCGGCGRGRGKLLSRTGMQGDAGTVPPGGATEEPTGMPALCAPAAVCAPAPPSTEPDISAEALTEAPRIAGRPSAGCDAEETTSIRKEPPPSPGARGAAAARPSSRSTGGACGGISRKTMGVASRLDWPETDRRSRGVKGRVGVSTEFEERRVTAAPWSKAGQLLPELERPFWTTTCVCEGEAGGWM